MLWKHQQTLRQGRRCRWRSLPFSIGKSVFRRSSSKQDNQRSPRGRPSLHQALSKPLLQLQVTRLPLQESMARSTRACQRTCARSAGYCLAVDGWGTLPFEMTSLLALARVQAVIVLEDLDDGTVGIPPRLELRANYILVGEGSAAVNGVAWLETPAGRVQRRRSKA
mmetsp:Transcript_42891/g.96280  ORF Transcript_42891/g.96280 Transcript_42891/m.96280 type:complete len:167 (+) Transcript_42891:627-1127(+)